MKKSLLILSALSLFSQAPLATIYRYTDENGKTIMTNTLPPEATQSGYEIIGDDGSVIERVPPPKTPAELKQEAKEKEKAKALEAEKAAEIEEAKQQAKEDNILLKSFSSQADIARSRDEKLEALSVVEDIANKNIKNLAEKLQALENQIKTTTQNNQTLPAEAAKQLQSLKQQLEENRAFLESKRLEKTQLKAHYQKMIERYQFLMKEKASEHDQTR